MTNLGRGSLQSNIIIQLSEFDVASSRFRALRYTKLSVWEDA